MPNVGVLTDTTASIPSALAKELQRRLSERAKHLAERTKDSGELAMTLKGSGAYQACRAAVDVLRERLPDVRVEVIDTLKAARSQGWAAIEAARSALEGKSLDEVVDRARIKIAYTHVAAEAEVNELRELVAKQFECVETITTWLSPVLGVHSGPGTVGVQFYPVE